MIDAKERLFRREIVSAVLAGMEDAEYPVSEWIKTVFVRWSAGEDVADDVHAIIGPYQDWRRTNHLPVRRLARVIRQGDDES